MKAKNADVLSTLVVIIYIHIGVIVTQEDPQSVSFVNYSFKDDMCDWESISAGWKIGQGSPTTSGTGSAHNHTLKNARRIYIYLDPKSVNTSQSQVLQNPLLPWSCLLLWYRSCGNDTGKRTVSIETKDTTTATKFSTTQSGNRTIYWSQEGKLDDKWHSVEITKQTEEAFRILFVGTTKIQNGAIAVDENKLSKCYCKDDCGFDVGFCNWIQRTSDGFRWIRTDGSSFPKTTESQSGCTNNTTGPQSHRKTKQTTPQSGSTNKTTDPQSHRNTMQTTSQSGSTNITTVPQSHRNTMQTTSQSGSTNITTVPQSHRNMMQTTSQSGRTNITTVPQSHRNMMQTTSQSGSTNKTTGPQSHHNTMQTTSQSGSTNKTTGPQSHRNTMQTTSQSGSTNKTTAPQSHHNTMQTTPRSGSTNKTTGPQSHRNTMQTTSQSGSTNKTTVPQSHRNTMQTTPRSGSTNKTTGPQSHRNTMQTTSQSGSTNKTTGPQSHRNTKQTTPQSGRTNKTTDPQRRHPNKTGTNVTPTTRDLKESTFSVGWENTYTNTTRPPQSNVTEASTNGSGHQITTQGHIPKVTGTMTIRDLRESTFSWDEAFTKTFRPAESNFTESNTIGSGRQITTQRHIPEVTVEVITVSLVGAVMFVVLSVLVGVWICRTRRRHRKKIEPFELQPIASKPSSIDDERGYSSSAANCINPGYTHSSNAPLPGNKALNNGKTDEANCKYASAFQSTTPAQWTYDTYDNTGDQTKLHFDGAYDHIPTHFAEEYDATHFTIRTRLDACETYDHVTISPDDVYDETCVAQAFTIQYKSYDQVAKGTCKTPVSKQNIINSQDNIYEFVE